MPPPGAPDANGGGGNTPDASGGGTDIDAAPPVVGETQCSDGIDNDNDGFVDGFDVHCVSALDNDESSFATGIPGDNKSPSHQDCFFDGNTGAGNDGCDIDQCCLLGTCPVGQDCTVTQECIDKCAPGAPIGCDCFGCCTICNGADCKDVLLGEAIDCQVDNLADDATCPSCTKIDACGSDCDTANCIPCPGQTEDDLPPECNNTVECPDGISPCGPNGECGGSQFCSNGCCLLIVG
ncbi:hypothetical protein [Haliangium sp.]|uniref:hypothetical protein n=1 Tax=Haliangium sp. TaxID=2663208 RepID=UPI003D10E8BC